MTPEELEKTVDLIGLKTLVLAGISADDLLSNPYQVVFVNDFIEFYNENNKIDSYNDLPAAIYADGGRVWFKNGKIHRNGDKPAVIYADGSREWYKNGKFIKKEKPQNNINEVKILICSIIKEICNRKY